MEQSYLGVKRYCRFVLFIACFLFACTGHVPETDSQVLVLEYDRFEGQLEPVLEDRGGALSSTFVGAELVVNVMIDEVVGSAGGPDGLRPADLDSFYPHIMNQEPAPSEWYAHGLLMPKCRAGSFPSEGFAGWLGLIWFREPTSYLRETFVVCKNTASSPPLQLQTSIHELAHVLNVHHCEYGLKALKEGLSLSDSTLEHLKQHRVQHVEFVRPGVGEPWCGELSDSHEKLHQELENEGVASCGSGDLCSIFERLAAAPLAPGVELKIAPEKDVYAPGEPVRLDVTLRRKAEPGDSPRYRSLRSLQPEFGALRIWLGDESGDFQPLQPMVLGEADLPIEGLKEGVTASGIDIWFPWQLAPSDNSGSLRLTATFTGFEDESLVAIANPVEIPIKKPPPPLFDPVAHQLFISEEARRFLFFLGGDHLDQGRVDLAEISTLHPQTIYAAYANLALGISWALPAHTFEKDRQRVEVRDPDPGKAIRYLDLANQQRDLLPPSYRRILDEMISRLTEIGRTLAPLDDEEQNRLQEHLQ